MPKTGTDHVFPLEEDLARFVRREARLIDEKRFDEWLALFTEDARYWVPAAPGQTDPLGHNSLAYEDRLLLELRIERLKSPRAYSQRPPSRCLHVLQELHDRAAKLGFAQADHFVRKGRLTLLLPPVNRRVAGSNPA